MRKLFIQFYLILLVFFLGAITVTGFFYEKKVAKYRDHYVADLLTASLYYVESSLKNTPEDQWRQKIDTIKHELSFPIQVRAIKHFHLDAEEEKALHVGSILLLDNTDSFLIQIGQSQHVLMVGPVPYLRFLRQIRLTDYFLLFLSVALLAIPVFLWLLPLWRDLIRLEQATQKLGKKQLNYRVQLGKRSGISRLGDSFNHMASDIQQLLEDKKLLSDAVAHELRTPLARIKYRLAILKEDQIAQNELLPIEQDLGEVEQLVEEMLLYSRLDSPEYPFHPKTIQTQYWLDNQLHRVALLFPHLTWSLNHSTVPSFQADEDLLSRALNNLLINAGKHAKQHVMISVFSEKTHWQIEIADDGEGILPQDQQRIFEPFVRLDSSRSRQTGGYGLGLAIVKRALEQHQGNVQVSRAKTLGGACFTLSWPKSI